MKYTSTQSSTIKCSFEDAICSGYAPDGGLFVPVSLPSISASTLQSWALLEYPVLAERVLRLFISAEEVSDEELASVCTSAFVGFADAAHAVPMIRLGDLHVAELFHGPTFCFKDLGMRAVVSFLSLFCTKRHRRVTLLVSTTGDTGPAAVQAVSDIGNPLLTIVVHYPHGQISSFQRKQLTTVESDCVRVASFEGGGDDMDKPIKNMQTSRSGNEPLMTGVNSYNIGRPLMQMVHYIWAYLRVAEKEGFEIGDKEKTVDVILPTGAMGNIAGGYMAKKMGVPLGKLCSGVNENDITHRVVQTGEFHKSPAMLKTLSDAINIQIPYNFERLLFYLTEQNHDLVRQWMGEIDSRQKLDLSTEWLVRLQTEFDSARVPDDEMCEMMRRVWEDHQYLVDPHTAVALGAADKLGYYSSSQKKAAVVLSTASPCKFEESVTIAVGKETWDMFRKSNKFPPTATMVEIRGEHPPILYKALGTLHESQAAWEKIAREVVAGLAANA